MRTFLTTLALSASLLLFAATADASSVSITLISAAGVKPGAPISFAANATGFTNPSFSVSDAYSGSSLSAGDINSEGYFSWTPTASDAGSHAVTVSVTDSAGDTASATITLTVISNAVFAGSLSPGAVVSVGRTITFSVSAPGFISPNYIVNDAYPGTTISGGDINSSGSFSWAPQVNQQGPHSLTIYAYDAYGHSGSATEAFTVTAPQVSLGAFKSVAVVGTKDAFQIYASGFANSTSFSVSDSLSTTTSLSASDISSTGAVSWTPSASDVGTHVFTFTVSDALGNAASTTASMTVTAAASAITSVPSPVANVPASAPTPVPTSVSSAPSATASGYVFSKVLSIGTSGASVTALQQRLTALGLYSGPVTGYFGALTAAAVVRFQKAHGLSQVGYLGPLTRAALNGS